LRGLIPLAVLLLAASVPFGGGAFAQSFRAQTGQANCPLPLGPRFPASLDAMGDLPGTPPGAPATSAAPGADEAPTLGQVSPAAAGSFPLQLDPGLSEARRPDTKGDPVFVRGDRVSGRLDRDTTLSGNAELRKGGTVVQADRITYYEADDELFAVGGVRVVQQGNVFVGPELRLRIDTTEGVFRSPSYLLPRYQGRGEAEQLEFLGPQRMELRQATYTTCPPDALDWILRADSLTVDEQKGEGRGRSASLYFKGVKILAAPYFEFPLGDERRSGLLVPSFSLSTQSGLEFVLPYYWNIAPNHDLTLYPRLMATRGVQLGADYRYLERNYFGETRVEITPSDTTTHTSRHYYSSQHTIVNLAGWSGGWNFKGVSDDNYFVDYARSILASSERSLPRDVYLSRGFGNWSVLMRSSRWQNILDAVAAPPYERVPQLQARHDQRNLGGFDIAGFYDATWFTKPLAGAPEGLRVIANPSISYPIQRPEGFLVPKLGVHLSTYRLDSNAGLATTLNRTVPIFSLDGGLVFERSTSYFGKNFTQTLEPRLFYVRTPYRDQSAYPVFDTAVANFNFAQLFAENSFVGGDRVADLNQLTTAVVSRMIDPTSGAEALRVALGQRLYFTDQRVSIPGVAQRTDARSDLLVAASGALGPTMSFDAAMQYSVQDSRFQGVNLSWRYVPGEQRVLNAGVRFLRSEIGQLDLSWQWPVAVNWRTMGRISYSWLDQRIDPSTAQLVAARPGIVESVLGVEYHACCWALRFVAQRYVTAALTTTSTFFIQLELKGVARIGSDPFDTLRRNIPGYQLPTDRRDSPSRYQGYE